MKSIAARSIVVVTLAATLAGLACGEDKLERGLAPPDEVAAPESADEMAMTAEQRREKERKQEARQERSLFEEDQ
jgi:hypothetical protein